MNMGKYHGLHVFLQASLISRYWKILLFFHKGQNYFYIVGNVTTLTESSGIIDLGLVFNFWLTLGPNHITGLWG